MRTFKQLIAASERILVSGIQFCIDEQHAFDDEYAVILPHLDNDEYREFYDRLVEHWNDQDYMYCFDPDEPIVGFENDDYKITSWKAVKEEETV